MDHQNRRPPGIIRLYKIPLRHWLLVYPVVDEEEEVINQAKQDLKNRLIAFCKGQSQGEFDLTISVVPECRWRRNANLKYTRLLQRRLRTLKSHTESISVKSFVRSEIHGEK